jgi:hypothetical protein
MRTPIRRFIFAAALSLAASGIAAAQYGSQPYGAAPYGSPQPYGQAVQPAQMPSAVFAGLIIAYEEHARWWKGQGVNLTPGELKARHWEVLYSQESANRLRVDFMPASPSMKGGDVGYLVDLTTLRVVERFFGR